MLVLTRKEGESIHITLAEDVDPNLRVADLFTSGTIQIKINSIQGKQVKVSIDAPQEFLILRDELDSRA